MEQEAQVLRVQRMGEMAVLEQLQQLVVVLYLMLVVVAAVLILLVVMELEGLVVVETVQTDHLLLLE